MIKHAVPRPGFRLKAAAMAKVTGEKAAATAAQLRQKAEEKDWTKEREYLGRTQKNLQGCVDPLLPRSATHHSASQQMCQEHVRRHWSQA